MDAQEFETQAAAIEVVLRNHGMGDEAVAAAGAVAKMAAVVSLVEIERRIGARLARNDEVIARTYERIAALERTVPALRAGNAAFQASNAELENRLATLATKALTLEAERDSAYAERNRLVALIARLARELKMPVGLRPASDAQPESAFQRVAVVVLPTGQCSWHFPERESAWFDGLDAHPDAWDGHTTADKHDRIDRYVAIVDAAHAERNAVGTQFEAPASDTTTDVTPPADGGEKHAPASVKCDAPGCTTAPVLECGCSRCNNEDTVEERFHACEAHRAEAAHVHQRVRERPAKWYSGPFGWGIRASKVGP